MAREFSIDLKQVKGTGAGGRITKADVESYMAAQGVKTAQQPLRPLLSRPHRRLPHSLSRRQPPPLPHRVRRPCRAPSRQRPELSP
jgi:pyruvate/2-oxoglutarate dehydrogenase complex dihydrolipoamide acyltransferase (E2) component